MLKQLKAKTVSEIDSYSQVSPLGAPYGIQIKFDDGTYLVAQVFDGRLLIAVNGKRTELATAWMPQTYLL